MKPLWLRSTGGGVDKFLLLITLVGVSATAWTQTPNHGDESVRRMILGGGIFGGDIKQVGRMGDRAAVGISGIIARMSPDAAMVERILQAVHLSFQRPAALPSIADREPKATLLLFEHLEAVTADASLKTKIADERRFVLEQVAKASAKDTPECLLANVSVLREPVTQESIRITQVYRILTDPTLATDALPLLRMGDAVTDFLSKIFGDCSFQSGDMLRTLAIVRGAFVRPEALGERNREPKRTLLLLDKLDRATSDQSERETISSTRNYVLAQAEPRNPH